MVEEVRFPDFGVLEAFITDGLRTLLHGATVPHMREMTLRYPGHADQVRLLRDLGLFSKEPIAVGGVTVSPIKVTSRLLFPLWKYEPGEEDVTVFRVEVDAVEDGGSKRHVYEILDRYDAVTGTSSMARTTGYVCTALVRLVASGGYSVPGITAPETLGRVPGCLDRVTRQLAARGVSLSHTLE
jgi:saccharopine dehydrogenase-like NADP-dependent oxidoreductase